VPENASLYISYKIAGPCRYFDESKKNDQFFEHPRNHMPRRLNAISALVAF